MLTLLVVAAIVVAALLGWYLVRRLGSDRIEHLNDMRRGASRMVGKGEFVDGNRHMAVALALDGSTFYYENADMQASLDLQWVREIEYDTELATGTSVEGAKVLRMRSDSQSFEFVIPDASVPRWHMMLPPRQLNTPATAAPLPVDQPPAPRVSAS